MITNPYNVKILRESSYSAVAPQKKASRFSMVISLRIIDDRAPEQGMRWFSVTLKHPMLRNSLLSYMLLQEPIPLQIGIHCPIWNWICQAWIIILLLCAGTIPIDSIFKYRKPWNCIHFTAKRKKCNNSDFYWPIVVHSLILLPYLNGFRIFFPSTQKLEFHQFWLDYEINLRQHFIVLFNGWFA